MMQYQNGKEPMETAGIEHSEHNARDPHPTWRLDRSQHNENSGRPNERESGYVTILDLASGKPKEEMTDDTKIEVQRANEYTQAEHDEGSRFHASPSLGPRGSPTPEG
jgi:hypothetical protein